MGITITANNSKYEFDMGYGGFYSLRKNISMALDKEFGENYANLGKCFSLSQFEENDHISEMIINKKHLDTDYKDVLDFLYMPDTEGKIGYRTCKKIADLLEPCMDDLSNKSFRYAMYAGHDYEDFLQFLRECVKYHRNMRWF